MLTASWAELVQLNAVWIIATVLTRDVVTSFAVATSECDLWTDVCTFFSHKATPSLVGDTSRDLRNMFARTLIRDVAEAGLEPATQRL